MFFMAGLALSLAALLNFMRKTFFPRTPAWSVLLLSAVGGLSTPVMWLITRPSVYETAIAGGQFFLVLGLYAALRGIRSQRGNAWLAFAGLAWGASVGCRVNNAVAIIWLTGLAGLYLLVRGKKIRGWLPSAVSLLTPLLAWAAGLGWYNLARFGSVLETGHRYQLTGPALPANYGLIASVHYILPNLYNYIFRPLSYAWKDFPFVFAPFITEKMWPWFLRLPEHYYYSEPVAGILLSIPIFWLAALPILQPLRAGWSWVNERTINAPEPKNPLLPWVWWMIAGAVCCNLGSLLVFISSTMRYLADVVPILTVLTAMCVWQEFDFMLERPKLRRLLMVIVIGLGLASVLIGLFVNFNVSDQRFATINPHLYNAIARFFTGKR
jgi:hypothetical protein